MSKLADILGNIVYPLFMLPAMGFLLIQVYQINARNAENNGTLIQHEKRIDRNEQSIVHLFLREKKPLKVLPLGPPLIGSTDRRSALRLKKDK